MCDVMLLFCAYFRKTPIVVVIGDKRELVGEMQKSVRPYPNIKLVTVSRPGHMWHGFYANTLFLYVCVGQTRWTFWDSS